MFCDLRDIPTLAATKALLNAGREKKKAAKSMEAYLMTAAVELSKFVRMDKYKRSRLASTTKTEVCPSLNREGESTLREA